MRHCKDQPATEGGVAGNRGRRVRQSRPVSGRRTDSAGIARSCSPMQWTKRTSIRCSSLGRVLSGAGSLQDAEIAPTGGTAPVAARVRRGRTSSRAARFGSLDSSGIRARTRPTHANDLYKRSPDHTRDRSGRPPPRLRACWTIWRRTTSASSNGCWRKQTYERALTIDRRILGDDHPRVAIASA